jgi:hypothetical protein
MKVCAEVDPPLREMADGRAAACHLHDATISGASRDSLQPLAAGDRAVEQNVAVVA